MSRSNENEIALYMYVTPETVELLRKMTDYLIITQSEVQMTSDKNYRVTTRVRRTENNETKNVLFESAIKYRLPVKSDGVSSCAEIENEITEEEYALALPFGERIYQKRRFLRSFRGVELDIDWGFVKSLNDYGDIIKIDINVPEGKTLSTSFLISLLKNLPNMGITIKDLVNPPWKFNPKIKERITKIMTQEWNLI